MKALTAFPSGGRRRLGERGMSYSFVTTVLFLFQLFYAPAMCAVCSHVRKMFALSIRLKGLQNQSGLKSYSESVWNQKIFRIIPESKDLWNQSEFKRPPYLAT